LGVRVIDRCNLTILNEPGHEDLAGFLATNEVEIVASLPCYLEENVDGQRGDGVFQRSLAGLRQLNDLGYGLPGSGRTLNLVYNPTGPSLPPDQIKLEAAYKEQLATRYGIVFNHLFALANMPIQRFGSTLISRGEFHDYMRLLKGAHRPENLPGVMCRTPLSVSWQGHVHDCDFNQMLGLPLGQAAGPVHLSELLERSFDDQPIRIADHCYGCTAGQGSSCGGALIPTTSTTTTSETV
jgi:radical SAM/Cys-rich protein